MGGYRSEDEALIGLARQLADAYGEARRREDQDFACDAIAEFLLEYRDSAPSQALLALLDLPLTAETYPLVDEVQTALAGRGPAVVRLLLGAMLGEVYDPDGPAPERAAETLDLMDRRDSVQGLVEVLCGRARDDVKSAAVDGLAALGTFAEPALAAALDDAHGGEWAAAALAQIRYERERPTSGETEADDEPGPDDDEAVRSGLQALDASLASWMGAVPHARDDGEKTSGGGEAANGGETPEGERAPVQVESEAEETDAGPQAPPPAGVPGGSAPGDAPASGSTPDDDEAPGSGSPASLDDAVSGSGDEAGGAPPALRERAGGPGEEGAVPAGSASTGAEPGRQPDGGAVAAGPEQQAVDDAYEEFLRRYRQESGEQ